MPLKIWQIRVRLLRWRMQVRRMSGALRITWAITCILVIGFFALWRLIGTERCLPILADAFPLVLAVAGIIMSYRPPKKERHTLATIALLTVGILGCFVLELVRSKSESAHHSEVTALQSKIDAVGSQNTKLLSSLITSPPDSSTSEVEHRKQIEDLLRNEYILSTNPVDPAILAGIKMPPDEWMNEHLARMGITWKFKGEVTTVANTTPFEKPEQPRIVFGFYDPNFGDTPDTFRIDPIANDLATFDVGFKVLGSATAQNVQVWVRKPDSATWVSVAPGYVEMGADHPSDRSMKTESIHPNVPNIRLEFKLQMPHFPVYTSTSLAFYYACDNCAPVDWKHPQTVTLSRSAALRAYQLFPSTSNPLTPLH